jgi:hypothetical protein
MRGISGKFGIATDECRLNTITNMPDESGWGNYFEGIYYTHVEISIKAGITWENENGGASKEITFIIPSPRRDG